jgi:hypothetical protein
MYNYQHEEIWIQDQIQKPSIAQSTILQASNHAFIPHKKYAGNNDAYPLIRILKRSEATDLIIL